MSDNEEKKISLHPDWKSQAKDREKKRRFFSVGKGWGKGFVEGAIFNKKMLHPYFWGAWTTIGILYCIVTFLPYRLVMLFGRLLGRLMGVVMPSRKYVLECNLKLAFLELSEEERNRLAHRILENSGMAIFETGMAWFWSDKRLLKRAVIDKEDLELAKKYAEENRPTLVFTCHFVTLEIMARLYALLIKPGIGVYRPSEHPVWEYAQVHGRLRSNLALVDRDDPRSMVKALMKGAPIWYAPDQDYGKKVSIFVPFFGVPDVATVFGTHNLARIKNTIVQPSWTVREHGKYRLYVKPPLENFPTEDVTEDTKRCNEVLEQMIRTAPDQYLWLHRRFKTTPDGVPTRYPKIEH